MIIGGGLGEEYMSAPRLNVGGEGGQKGKGGFIANLLDLLGIHHQVAKEPKGEKGGKSGEANPAGKITATGGAPGFTPMMGAQTSPAAQLPPPSLSVLDDAESAFQPLTPMASNFGKGMLSLIKPGLR